METHQPIISFATGSLGSVPILETVIRESLGQIDPAVLLHYGNPLGMWELRQQVARLHPGIDENEVMIVSSAQQALGLVFDHLLRNGPKVFVQEPAYFGTLRLLRKHRAEATVFETFADLQERLGEADIVYLTSNFHNPTGYSLALDDKQQLADWARGGGIVIEDNPHDQLYYEQKPTTIRELAPQHTFYIGGFSKILGPGIRVSYLVTDAEKLGKLKSGKIDADLFTSTLGQQLCTATLQRDFLDALRAHFKAKRDLALASLKEHVRDLASWNEPAGGIYLLLSLPASVSLTRVLEFATHNGLVLEDDRYTYLDGGSRNTTRINFVQNPEPILVEGIRKLARTLEEAAQPWK
jgi:2-aminoadipate transaminase